MNLNKLINMQKQLDTEIRQKKSLEGQDLTANTFVALQVELAEFANEGRWFKHWSKDQEPRRYDEQFNLKTNRFRSFDPLLEEYVDSLHFFLSLAIQKEWEEALYIYEEQLDPEEFDGDLTAWYLEMTYFLNKSYFENPNEEQNQYWVNNFGYPAKQYWFRAAWILFLNIGINGFNFTLEQIEQAYLDKNKVNHERQANGY
nr:dUTP diphosphatase [Priestia megaterium]